jgi:hypothetical protein
MRFPDIKEVFFHLWLNFFFILYLLIVALVFKLLFFSGWQVGPGTTRRRERKLKDSLPGSGIARAINR